MTIPAPGPAWAPSDRELERQDVRRRLRRRSLLVAGASTSAFFVLLGVGLVLSPGWEKVRETFFSWSAAQDSFPLMLDAFWLNVRIFLVAEPAILVLALLVAVMRGTRSAWLAPVRIVAVAFTDIMRGIPTLLLVVLLGFGVPALQLQGLTTDRLVWATVALILSYSAYVAEVFRAGIESIHPSQIASARALGLGPVRTLRHVVVPQAVRRVVPPLLNDFISLQKDTALVSLVGVYDGVFAARDYASYNFNYTSLVVVALFFIVLTVPLARFTDWLQRRVMERERAGSL
ncbi:putative glutamine ABC transporter permease protein GlnM [Nocardioides dokdonensis FR1436]|uniref:Putative glutamine ABC transporter permease protein GlnM n=1 Tax=Nocardioides dokdonensis FR1436 TaxID=1300347 RepID=A0A1A9GH60_9ACTN|nr:amino acid ABC transporter permease [Nocardioides dokdonensis]ANH37574.1 putative glutamine ABC transporter permease protein GlnM [Nocardioides dokdonensis FR1436]